MHPETPVVECACAPIRQSDSAVLELADEVRAADWTRTRLRSVPQSLPQSVRPSPESSNRFKPIFANAPSKSEPAETAF